MGHVHDCAHFFMFIIKHNIQTDEWLFIEYSRTEMKNNTKQIRICGGGCFYIIFVVYFFHF